MFAPTCLPGELLGLSLTEGADLAGMWGARARAQRPQAGRTAVHGQSGQFRGDLLGLGDQSQQESPGSSPLVSPPFPSGPHPPIALQ
jgi:hypothetical protein